ncbi:hypothetical protein GCM10008019_34200 [Deinococcus soli (ex Cha et al. 2016)]|jgi:hypothetical protein|nr:hypothetical protein GCM10008019_34200 [Deinococcus soli (ex Cha et al. 2016)]
MTEGHAKVARVVQGIGHFAEVSLRVSKANTPGYGRVQFLCTGKGFVGQGYLEEVSPEGYEDWKTGAEAGVLFALKCSNWTADVYVDAISGLSSDTNEWTVAEAAAKAVWNALETNLDSQVLARLEHLVDRSWCEEGLRLDDLESLLLGQIG